MKSIYTARMIYLAAIDIGSNAIRLAIAHLNGTQLHISYRSREPVRLGASVFSQGSVDEASYLDLKQALVQFSNQLQNHNVRHYRAVATSALREADNGQEVISQLLDETGISIELISGEEEARLVSLAISQQIDLQQGTYLLIDIGGGSIELIALSDGQVLKKQSFVLGMVRILELQKQKSKALKQWFPQHIQNEVSSFFKDLPPLQIAVGTGGNMDRFIKLKPFVSDEGGIDLTSSQLRQLYQLLDEVDYRERIRKFCLKPDRADVIIPAALATLEFMGLGQSEKILFPQVGLKDGVLQDLLLSSKS
jgi:exopolyphosphatase/guanosine-5'-triphosphate,3'-diphosphate pyrophosphatase